MVEDVVPVEYIGRARALRASIAKDEERYLEACDKLIRPLRPRPAWPTDRLPRRYLRQVAQKFILIRSPCRIMTTCKIDDDGKLKITELRASPSELLFPGWEQTEPSIQLTLYLLESPPFEERAVVLSEVGQHAIARRYHRGSPNHDTAVLDDLIEIGAEYANAIRNTDTEFQIDTRRGGCWLAGLSTDQSVIAVRTFI
jgi:hypothetical protein